MLLFYFILFGRVFWPVLSFLIFSEKGRDSSARAMASVISVALSVIKIIKTGIDGMCSRLHSFIATTIPSRCSGRGGARPPKPHLGVFFSLGSRYDSSSLALPSAQPFPLRILKGKAMVSVAFRSVRHACYVHRLQTDALL